jgi:hypothetical protein
MEGIALNLKPLKWKKTLLGYRADILMGLYYYIIEGRQDYFYGLIKNDEDIIFEKKCKTLETSKRKVHQNYLSKSKKIVKGLFKDSILIITK